MADGIRSIWWIFCLPCSLRTSVPTRQRTLSSSLPSRTNNFCIQFTEHSLHIVIPAPAPCHLDIQRQEPYYDCLRFILAIFRLCCSSLSNLGWLAAASSLTISSIFLATEPCTCLSAHCHRPFGTLPTMATMLEVRLISSWSNFVSVLTPGLFAFLSSIGSSTLS